MKYSGKAIVARKILLSEKIFSLELICPEIAIQARPGQFVQLRIPGFQANIWPRPFSIYDAGNDKIVLYIKKYGRITDLLANIKANDILFVTGPLGNGFELPNESKGVVMVAGGVGLPPLYFLCKTLLNRGFSPEAIRFYSGAKNRSELFAHESMASLGVTYIVATEDGSVGYKGLVTEPLEWDLRQFGGKIIYGCGPMAMMKKVAEICRGHRCLLSLEQLMPCGWGVCNGCAVKIKDGSSVKTEDERGFRLARVCKEGPVFDSGTVLWD